MQVELRRSLHLPLALPRRHVAAGSPAGGAPSRNTPVKTASTNVGRLVQPDKHALRHGNNCERW